MTLWRRFLSSAQSDGLRAQLVRGGIGSIALKVTGLGLSLAVTLVLARVLGPDGYGVYAYVLAVATLLTIPAQFGIPGLVMRETAKAHANEDWATLKGLWRWADMTAVLFSLLLAGVGLAVGWIFASHFTRLQLATGAWAFLLLPLVVLVKLRGGALRGLRYVVTGQLPDVVLRPGLLILFVLIALGWDASHTLNASQAMSFNVLATGLALLISAATLHHVGPAASRVYAHLRYNRREWTAAALPLGMVAGMQLINQRADILFLGFFVKSDQIGLYRAAAQGAQVAAFGLQAVNMMAGPHIARFSALGNTQRLQRFVSAITYSAVAIALPASLCFAIFGNHIISWVFGSPYIEANYALLILVFGQLINAAMGPTGLVLNMSGHERTVLKAVSGAAVCNCVLNLVLIPRLGIEGAAIATAITFLLWNTFLAVAAHKKLNVNTTIFHWFRK